MGCRQQTKNLKRKRRKRRAEGGKGRGLSIQQGGVRALTSAGAAEKQGVLSLVCLPYIWYVAIEIWLWVNKTKAAPTPPSATNFLLVLLWVPTLRITAITC